MRKGSGIKPSCHPERAHQAKGLCDECYKKNYRKNNKTKIKIGLQENYQRNREIRLKSFKEYYNNNKETMAAAAKLYKQTVWRYKRYGLTKEQYEKMLEDCNNSCQICDKPERLVIDHDHETKKVRGILCNECNIMLGWFENRQQIINRYIGGETWQ